MKCYCLSGLSFTECCEPFITRQKLPQTAEQLMRSRYSAYNSKAIDYIMHTQILEQPVSFEDLEKTVESTHWIGLKILNTEKGQATDNEASVEFVAFFTDSGIHQLHENSNFIKKDNQWFYTSGTYLPEIKQGPNVPCFCGSGKKQKKCHPLRT